MRKILSTVFIGFLLFAAPALFGQTPGESEDSVQMAEGLYANGKIYVVVAVILTVVAGMIIYMIRLDRKISRLEKEA